MYSLSNIELNEPVFIPTHSFWKVIFKSSSQLKLLPITFRVHGRIIIIDDNITDYITRIINKKKKKDKMER